MDASTPLWKAHDVSQQLQDKLEELPNVERAFVHVDHETTHAPVCLSSLPVPDDSRDGNSGTSQDSIICFISCRFFACYLIVLDSLNTSETENNPWYLCNILFARLSSGTHAIEISDTRDILGCARHFNSKLDVLESCLAYL